MNLATGAHKFHGVVHSAFDGTLLLLDSLGGVQRAVLVLTAGGKRINCNIDNVDDEQLRKAYKRRCVVQGMAHYAATSGLPERVDVRDIRVVDAAGDIGEWQGKFAIPEPGDDAWV